jgi:spore maturation protein CgeB
MKYIAVLDSDGAWRRGDCSANQFVKGFVDLGCTVEKYTSFKEAYDSKRKYDLIINTPQITNANDLNVIEQIKKENEKCKIITCSHLRVNLSLLSEFSRLIDLCYTFCSSYSWMKNLCEEQNIKYMYIPHSSNQDLFFDTKKQKNVDFSFIGRLIHGDRNEREYLFDVHDKFSDLTHHCYGYNYKHITNREISYFALNDMYNETKVNLNFHYPSQKIDKGTKENCIQFNTRLYDIAMSNQFQMCDSEHIIEEFEDTIPYINKDEWLYKFEYYLNNDKIRNDIAYKSNQVALRKHTCKARMKKLIMELNK